MNEFLTTRDARVGCTRSALVVVLVRIGWQIQRLAVTLLPADSEFRQFKERALATLDGTVRLSLEDRYSVRVIDAICAVIFAVLAVSAIVSLIVLPIHLLTS